MHYSTPLSAEGREALYELALTLRSRDILTVALGMTGDPRCLRAAILALATAMPDLTGDAPEETEADPYAEYRRLIGEAPPKLPDALAAQRQAAAETILAAYTAGLDAGERAAQWDVLCESVVRRRRLHTDGPDGADLPDPMPAGTTAYGTWVGDVDECDTLINGALDALTAAPVVWAAA